LSLSQINPTAAAFDDRDLGNANSAENVVRVLWRTNLELKTGETMAIVGPVGSGKSTIVNAILGEARVVSGEVKVGGSMAYVPQTPWIQVCVCDTVFLFVRVLFDMSCLIQRLFFSFVFLDYL